MQSLAPMPGSALFYSFPRIQSRTRLISPSFVAFFRSTPASGEKWKNKWNHTPAFEDVKPSKTYIRYKTRQKRADAKKALNDIYFGSGSSNFTLEGEFIKKRGTKFWDEDPIKEKKKRDSSARFASKAHPKRKKNKSRKANFFDEFDDEEVEDDDDPWKHFQATFGDRRYSWSFKSWEESFSQSKKSGSKYSNRDKWRTVSDDDSTEDEDSSHVVGSHSDRVALGLPINGPLKIEEVKKAFRLSALKWHPDKHQGPSQALAEEKFKLCASAYKSLCNALSGV